MTPQKGQGVLMTAEEAYQSDLARVSAQLAAAEALCAEKDEIIKRLQDQLNRRRAKWRGALKRLRSFVNISMN